MGLFDLFSNKKKTAQNVTRPANSGAGALNQDKYQQILEMLSNRSPSEQFASGAVFDMVRQNHDTFARIVQSKEAMKLLSFFSGAYSYFVNNPQSVGLAPAMVKKENNDTNPNMWNADLIRLENNDMAALCFIPVANDTCSARIVGILIGSKGDGYYYCMLKKDGNAPSEVIRNLARPGIFPPVGTVKGTGMELMRSFLECIQRDYYQR